MSVRPRVTPKINLSAKTVESLITWKKGQVWEPVFTCNLSKADIQKLVDKPLVVPDYSLHTQSTERAVKSVTEAAAAVVGHEARDGFIRGRVHHREGMPSFKSKKDIVSTFECA